MAEFAISRAAFGSVLAASLFGYMLGAGLVSPLGDRWGRKPLIVFGAAAFGLFTLATAAATSLTGFFVGRTLTGVGLGAAMPAALSLASEYAPARMRGRILGLSTMSLALGGALGGLLASVLIPRAGWIPTFLVGGFLPLALCVLLAWRLPESLRFLALKGGRDSDIARILERLRFGRFDRPFISVDERANGARFGALFARASIATTLLLWASFCQSFTGNYFLLSWLPTLAADSGLTPRIASLAGGALLLGGAIGSVLVGAAVDRYGLRVVAVVFAIGAAFEAYLGSVLTVSSASVILACVTGIFILGGQLGLIATASAIYPTSLRATGVGWALAVARIGSIIGPMIGGTLLDLEFAPATLLVIAAVPEFVTAACMAALSGLKLPSAAIRTAP
jgi:AAHS family 4-hydroxybenzoate transporter-like MFS transporter